MEGESNTFDLHSISYHSSVGNGNKYIALLYFVSCL
jgi:hypothetical protein